MNEFRGFVDELEFKLKKEIFVFCNGKRLIWPIVFDTKAGWVVYKTAKRKNGFSTTQITTGEIKVMVGENISHIQETDNLETNLEPTVIAKNEEYFNKITGGSTNE